jgi:membrane-associated protease RseP (regulator of RpoE activity)
MRKEDENGVPEDALALRPRWWLHIALFAATFVTTTGFGVMMAASLLLPEDIPEAEVLTQLADVAFSAQGIGMGLGYSVSLLAILLAHEMGHYLTARRYGVSASPPYFLPGLPPFGTFGAFIRMRIREIDATRLFRIAVGGPYAGFIVCLPLLILGLCWSDVRPVPPELAEAALGESILMWVLTKAMFGTLPEGHDVFLHPVAYAGWVGLFVTSFNLVPLSQLDGGHVAYTMFGKKFNAAAWLVLLGLIGLGVLVFPGWLLLVFFALIMGPTHPVELSGPPLGPRDRALGWGALAMFVVTFVPRPFVLPTILDLVLGK